MRVVYNSKIAKAFTFMEGFSTIMLFGVVYTELSRLSNESKAHEEVHVKQYWDCFYAGLSFDIIMLFVLLGIEASFWWFIPLLFIPFLLFYAFYGIEFLIRWTKTKDKKKAYLELSMEKQARWIAETWDKPCLEQNHYVSFEWFKFL